MDLNHKLVIDAHDVWHFFNVQRFHLSKWFQTRTWNRNSTRRSASLEKPLLIRCRDFDKYDSSLLVKIQIRLHDADRLPPKAACLLRRWRMSRAQNGNRVLPKQVVNFSASIWRILQPTIFLPITFMRNCVVPSIYLVLEELRTVVLLIRCRDFDK